MVRADYNRFRSSCPRFNLVVGCDLINGRPQYMRVVPGNLKEGCMDTMLDEFSIDGGTILVMDLGYFDRKLVSDIRAKGLDYLVSVKRNSKIYDEVRVGEGMFRWRDSAVGYGVSMISECEWVYRFENLNHRNDEHVDTLQAQEPGRRRDPKLDKAGNFIMVSSRKMEPGVLYRL